MVFPILYYKSEIVQPVTVLINHMITAGIFPNKLKIAKVVSLHQLGDNTLFSNYRHISILPSLNYSKKMFTHNSMPILKVINYSIAVNMALDKVIQLLWN